MAKKSKTPDWPRDHAAKHREAARKGWRQRKETSKARYRATKHRAFSGAKFRGE